MRIIRLIYFGSIEVYKALFYYKAFLLLASLDIKLRYRRSTLGPLWITLTSSFFILFLSLLWTKILDIKFSSFFLNFSFGYIFWLWFLANITDSSNGFMSDKTYLMQHKIPMITFVFRHFFKNFYILLHNLILILVIALFFVNLNFLSLLVFPLHFFIVSISLFSMSLILTVLCTRFHDLNPIVNSLMQVIFFSTPILWPEEKLRDIGYDFLIDFNPFAQWISLLKTPISGVVFDFSDYLIPLIYMVIFVLFALYIVGRSKKKIMLWL